MLKVDLHWLIPIVLMGSDRIMHNGFSKDNDKYNNSWRNCYRLAVRDYQSYLSGRLRKEDIDKVLNVWIDDINSSPNLLNILHRIKNEFIDWGGDRFEVKHRKLEGWLSLLSQIDPAWIIGFGYAELIINGVLSVEQVNRLLLAQCPNALPKRFDNEPVADNHVHLGGNGHYNLSLASLILYLEKRPDLQDFNWPYRQEHSLFNSEGINIEDLPVLFHLLFDRCLNVRFGNFIPNNEILDLNELAVHNVYPQVNVIKDLGPNDNVNKLLLASIDGKGNSSWLMITTAIILQLYKPISSNHKSLLQSFIQSSSIMRNYMIVSGVGLGEFVTFFSFKYRKPLFGLNYKNQSVMHDLFPNYYREFRSGMSSVREYIREAKFLLTNNLSNQIHFVYHFSRSYNENSKINRLYEDSRKKNLNIVRGFQDFLRSVTFSNYSLLDEIKMENVYVDLRALVRGFDVAGNENEVPIEVFAPVLRVIRSATYHYMHSLEERLRQPFLTLHAGEDFSHIISGLRSIDESVTFCDFRPNDRIGHGLALGLSPKKWAKRQQRIYLPLQEHLDNLVWLYHKGTELLSRQPGFHSAILLLSEKIRYFSNELYGREYSPLSLYQAWFLRRNCPLFALEKGDILGSEWKLWVPDAKLIMMHSQTEISSEACDLWKKYLERPRHDVDTKTLVSISYEPDGIVDDFRIVAGNLEEILTEGELDLIEAIQDLMIERFSQSQWILEVCPTSNIYIGRLEKYSEHPIFRWSPPRREDLLPGGTYNRFGLRKGPVRVCINTDDAGLMPTTLENEYRIIKDCAINNFCVSDQDACQWIDSIRRTGVELFKTNHLEWVK